MRLVAGGVRGYGVTHDACTAAVDSAVVSGYLSAAVSGSGRSQDVAVAALVVGTGSAAAADGDVAAASDFVASRRALRMLAVLRLAWTDPAAGRVVLMSLCLACRTQI